MPTQAIDPDGRLIIIIGTPEYRNFVNQKLAMLRMTDAGREIYNKLQSSPHRIYIQAPTKLDYDAAKRRTNSNGKVNIHISDQEITSYNDVSNRLLLPFKANLGGDFFSSINVLPPLGHELYHAFVDVVDFGNNSQLLDERREFTSNNDLMERPAMAFEQYIRDIFDMGSRSQYGYKAGNNIAKKFDLLFANKHTPNDIGAKIQITNYGWTTKEGSGGLDMPVLKSYIYTGFMEYVKTHNGTSTTKTQPIVKNP